ncbi:hypothetical protein EFP51_02760 [Lactobacillus johnsonii]|uniref:hypothetical protein n=1 Tax=Lactobacillus johnsonii TaxID=33959 RepID=UPI0021A7F350|nr:hypothetical protein [Lactobacillus johnsonii]MCT3382265.1 hypothetical protein [Lactobacillus johnsonii]MCT3387295.1 hypothetical protein [Lactobacillus johnsonii]
MGEVNIVNNGKPYFFRFDIAKEGGMSARITDYLKTRVNDNGKKVPVKWFDQGMAMNVHGMSPFIQGGVGHWTPDDNNELLPGPDVVYRDWQGTPADVTDDGMVYYTLEDQFFCKQGQFKGIFGLRDSNGNVFSSVNIIFEIQGNDFRIHQTTEYYSSELEKMKAKFANDTDQTVKDFNAKIEAGIETNRQNLNLLRTSIQANRDEQATLAQNLIGTKYQIESNNIIKTADFLAGMSQEKTAREKSDDEIIQRFNSFLKDGTGKDSNSAPEIIDARLSTPYTYNRKYGTLGEAIRTQILSLYQALISSENQTNSKISEKNLETLNKFQDLYAMIRNFYKLNSASVVDQGGEQIETEDGSTIDTDYLTEKIDSTLTQSNQAADAYSVGQALKRLENTNPNTPVLSGGDLLLSEVPSQPIKFSPEQATEVGLVVKPTGEGFDSKMVESPSIIWDDTSNQFIMVYTAYDSNDVGSIGYATSKDLKTWHSQGQLLKNSGDPKLGDKNGCTGPCLVKFDGIYYLFYLGLNAEGYEGGQINLCLATSADLQSWTYKGIVLSPDKNIPWISNTIYHPDIMRVGNYWYIFFNANGTINSQAAERTGFAYSTKIDGPYTVDPDRISKFAEDAGNHGGIQCGDPSIFKIGNLYYMFYFDTSHGSEVVDRYAWTTPAEFPRGWRYGGPVIKNDKDYNKDFAHKPFVLIKDNILYHYYTAVGDQGRCIALQTFDLTNNEKKELEK